MNYKIILLLLINIREQASPIKKRILIKRYQNNSYQNQNEDEDNNYERNE